MSDNLSDIDAYLVPTGWSRHKLEVVIGVKISGAGAQKKRTAWKLILDPEARSIVDIVRLWCPEAVVEAIR